MENKNIDDILNESDTKETEEVKEAKKDLDKTSVVELPKRTEATANEDEDVSKTRMMDSIKRPSDVASAFDDIPVRKREAVKKEEPVQEKSDDEITEEEYQEYLREKKERQKKIKAHNRHRRTFSHILVGVLLSVLIVSVSAFLSVYIIKSALDFTGIGKTYCQAQIHISEDDSTDDIADRLAALGIITMPDFFKVYVSASESENDFINGTFTVDTTMSYSTLLMTLQTISTINETVTIQITEGMTIEDISILMEENLVCRADDFRNACMELEQTYKFQKRLDDEPLKYYQMEGYIFPDTYEFYILPALEENKEIDTTEFALDALDKIYQNFNNKITSRLYNRMNELGLTLDETITLASIVQREADNKANMGNVASVFFNRMAIPEAYPHLESDVTVFYIDDNVKIHIPQGELKDYEDCFNAYNSYICDGIPVGPICNPGLDAIKAVLYPPETSYYYFCADPETTEMYFAETIEEHEENLRICGLDSVIAD